MALNFGRPLVRVPARGGVVLRRLRYQHDSKPAALESVDLILSRGNAVRMVNAAGKFFVTELVLS